jgi:hypothetical protein
VSVEKFNAVKEFNAKVVRVMRKEKVCRAEASRRVCRRSPKLHRAALLEANGNSRDARRQVRKRFEE